MEGCGRTWRIDGLGIPAIYTRLYFRRAARSDGDQVDEAHWVVEWPMQLRRVPVHAGRPRADGGSHGTMCRGIHRCHNRLVRL